jgi:hypothetical protein
VFGICSGIMATKELPTSLGERQERATHWEKTLIYGHEDVPLAQILVLLLGEKPTNTSDSAGMS